MGGKLTLIDCPGLSDSEGRDQQFLDEMTTELKGVPIINLIVLIITGDRLANSTLIENVKLLEVLCGGQSVWKHVIVVVTRVDYNPMEMEEKDWLDSLEEKEDEVKEIFQDKFG